jgi:hypothetical protein
LSLYLPNLKDIRMEYLLAMVYILMQPEL